MCAHAEPRIRTVLATRYVAPLREGGSLPAIVEADDLGTYVLKFRGAGQGPRVLIAELVAGEVARLLGLPMPELVFVDLDPVLGRSEPDPEIQDLIRSSAGLNLGMDYLPGAFAYDPHAAPPPEALLASGIVWFDALTTNVDRTPNNTNLLLWYGSIWLIDNGASLFVQYGSPDYTARSTNPFPQIRDHVLLPYASRLAEVDGAFADRLQPNAVRAIVDLIPEGWLDASGFGGPGEQREALAKYLLARLAPPRAFVQEALDARAQIL